MDTTLLPRLHRCSTCAHWAPGKVKNEDGVFEAICTEPKDSRDHKFKRGSDYCSKWKLDTWRPL